MLSPVTTLQEAAEAREQARLRLEAARAKVAEVQPLMDAANEEARHARQELDRIDLAMTSVKLAHKVQQAIEQLGIPTEDPPMLVEGTREGSSLLPDVFTPVAVSTEGIALYARVPKDKRDRRGKSYCIRPQHVPQAVLDKLAELRAINDAYRDSFTGIGNQATGEERSAAAKARDAEIKRVGAEIRDLTGSRPEPGMGPRREVDLFSWEARGKGDFGQGSGAYKPLAPPTGGRWRWLKVEEQQELEAE